MKEIYITFDVEATEILEDSDLEEWKRICEEGYFTMDKKKFNSSEEYMAYVEGLSDALCGVDNERAPAMYYILDPDNETDAEYISIYENA